jgi:hypothetical protein
MDFEFLAKLDEQISNVGRDEYWKREVGGRTVWLAPVSYTAQLKVTETITTEGISGAILIAESKRVSLSHAIVGIDDIDLRPYRDSGEVFSIPDPRKPGEVIKVDLPKYIYTKMANWGTDWMDTTFDVFADLMESFNKGNKSKVKFENVKEPTDELVELEMRVAELRGQLKLPQLIESEVKDTQTEVSDGTEASVKIPGTDVPFDPFKTLPEPEEAQEAPIQESRPNIPPPVTSLPVTDMDKLSPIEQALASRRSVKSNVILEHGAPQSTPDKPLVGLPSVNQEVLDQRMSGQLPVAPPQINKNPANQSRNPRFSKPIR